MTSQRIAKIIARSGLCSRRDAEKLILKGRVSVNGAIATDPATNVTIVDVITVDGMQIQTRPKTRLWKFHKPRGVITSHKDPQGRKTVFDMLPKEIGRVISVGRLDYNTEGLLLLTNDGELSRLFESPTSLFPRVYRAKLYGKLTDRMLRIIRTGINLNGFNYKPAEIWVDHVGITHTWVTVSIREGKNREIRNMFEYFNIQVSRLIRVSYHTFALEDLDVNEIEEIPLHEFAEFL